MLRLERLVGGGAERRCFVHPLDARKCVKVALKQNDERYLLREARVAEIVRPFMPQFIVNYENKLVDTDHGRGLICDLLRDDEGEISKSLDYYRKAEKIDAEIIEEIHSFAHLLITKDIFFYDFNYRNFVVKQEKGRKKLFFVDLKSFHKNGCLHFLNLEYVFAPFARNIMFRRMKRILYTELGIPFPWEKLYRESYFRTFLVRIK